MAARAPRWMRIVRRRPASFIALVLLSAAAVLVSAITPMLLAALDAATLREQVAASGLPQNGVSVTAQIDGARDRRFATDTVGTVLTAAGRGSDRWGGVRQVLEWRVRSDLERLDGRGPTLKALFSIAPTGCRGLRLTGRCPEGVDETAVPESLASSTGWRTGTALIGGLRVVGVYDDAEGAGALLADPAILQGAPAARAVPNLLLGESVIGLLEGGFHLTAARQLVRPVRAEDLPALRRGLAAVRRESLSQDSGSVEAQVTTGLGALLDGVERQQTASATLMAPIGLAALVLAWSALFVVALRTARVRAVEWGIDRSRGLPPRAWLVSVFAEPVAAVALGAAVGYPIAVGAAAASASAVLGSPAIAPFTVGALVAAALAVAGSLVALVVASAGAALMPLDALLRDSTEPRRVTRPALAARILLLTLTGAVLWIALTGPPASGPQLVLLLPVLLALSVGLAARQAAVLVVRHSSRRPPRGLAGLTVGRALARAPSALLAAQVVLVAASLATYVLQVQAVSAGEQRDRAQLVTGAAQVLRVAVPDGVSLLDAVRRADPTGRIAMAVEEVGDSDDDGAAHVVAVDASRLAGVSSWRPEWRGSASIDRVRTRIGPELVVLGRRLSMTVSAVRDGPSFSRPRDALVTASVVLARTGGWQTVQLGGLRDGTLTARIPCDDGCRVVSLDLEDPAGTTMSPWGVRFTVTALATDRQSAAALRPWLQADRWRERVVDLKDPVRPATIAFSTVSDGLDVTASDRVGETTARGEPANGPAVIPAVVADATPLSTFAGVDGAVQGSALSAAPVLLRPVGRAPALPRTLRSGALVDLAALNRVTDPADSAASHEVWLTSGRHPGVLAALERQGLRVVGRLDASDAVRTGLEAPTNRALVFSGTTAVGGLLFAVLALVAAAVIDAPGRRRDQRVLRMAGTTPSRLRRLTFLRAAAPAAVAVPVGIGAGLTAGALTVARLPLLVDTSPGPLLGATPPWSALALLAAGLLVLVLVAALIVARLDLPGRRR